MNQVDQLLDELDTVLRVCKNPEDYWSSMIVEGVSIKRGKMTTFWGGGGGGGEDGCFSCPVDRFQLIKSSCWAGEVAFMV